MPLSGIPGGLINPELPKERRTIVELLTRAYWMQVATVMNYLAASIRHEGARGLAVPKALRAVVEEEIAHTRALGRRIQELHGVVPGIEGIATDEEYAEAPGGQSDVAAMIEAVVATETSAIRYYMRIMRATADVDQDTNDLVLDILAAEERHLRLFEGHLRGYRRAAA